MGRTIISKVIAAKRPGLIPLHDRRIRDLLHPTSPGTNDWEAWQHELTSNADQVSDVVGQLMNSTPAAAGLSTLRTLDIALWQYARRTVSASPSLE
jgi:hypothetical protein